MKSRRNSNLILPPMEAISAIIYSITLTRNITTIVNNFSPYVQVDFSVFVNIAIVTYVFTTWDVDNKQYADLGLRHHSNLS